jgi:hypothetical protein
MFYYIISGVCHINRHITHYIIPHIKKDIITELQEIGIAMFNIMNGIQY